MSAVMVVLATAGVLGQQPRPAFEVASVRPTNSTLPVSRFAAMRLRVMPGGVFRATTTVQALIGFAHDLKDFQIVGGPDWIGRDGFEVNAKALDSDAPPDQVKAMIRTLLEERLGLVSHTEQREVRHHALVLLRAPDRLGPYLRHFPDDCAPPDAARVRDAFPPREASRRASITSGNCTEIGFLVDSATLATGLPVIDETGLTGKVVFNLHYGSSGVTTAATPADEPGLPPFADAIEEQLGLKLEARRGPIDVLVVDSVHQPTEN